MSLSPIELLKQQGYLYADNPNTNEFHRLKRLRPECNADQIANPTGYKRGRDARAKGRDACGHCNFYWKSRDNK